MLIVELLDGDAGADARGAGGSWHRLAAQAIGSTPTRAPSGRQRPRQPRQQFRATTDFWTRVGERFSRERAALEIVFARDPARDADHDPARLRDPGPARRRAGRDRRRAATPRRRRQATPPLSDFAWSLVHMHANRLLHASQRAQELILYDFLRGSTPAATPAAARLARRRRPPRTPSNEPHDQRGIVEPRRRRAICPRSMAAMSRTRSSPRSPSTSMLVVAPSRGRHLAAIPAEGWTVPLIVIGDPRRQPYARDPRVNTSCAATRRRTCAPPLAGRRATAGQPRRRAAAQPGRARRAQLAFTATRRLAAATVWPPRGDRDRRHGRAARRRSRLLPVPRRRRRLAVVGEPAQEQRR